MVNFLRGTDFIYHGTCAAGWRGLGPPGARMDSDSNWELRLALWALATVKLGQSGYHPPVTETVSTDCAGQSLAPLHRASDGCWCASHKGSQSALWIWNMTAPTLGPQICTLVHVQPRKHTHTHEYKRWHRAIAGNINGLIGQDLEWKLFA